MVNKLFIIFILMILMIVGLVFVDGYIEGVIKVW